MKIFLSLSPEHPASADARESFQGHVRQVTLAREAGFAGVTVGQHLTTEGMQWFPPIPLLSRLAPHCEGMEIGTGVVILPFTHPVLLAESMAFLDVISGGRSILGVAAGWTRAEFAALGAPMQGRTARTKEGVELIRRLWTEDDVTYRGTHYSVESLTMALRPVRQPHPPIWIGASAERTVRSLAGVADALVHSSHIALERLISLQAAFADERAQLGLSVPADVPVLRNVFVGPDRETAWDRCVPYMRASYQRYDGAGLFADVLSSSGANASDVANDILIVGSPDEVADGLRAVRDRLGATTVLLRMQWYGMPSPLVEESIRLFGERVLPQVSAP